MCVCIISRYGEKGQVLDLSLSTYTPANHVRTGQDLQKGYGQHSSIGRDIFYLLRV